MTAKERRLAVEACERRLHICSALARALEDPSRVFALVINAHDIEAAKASIRREYSVDEVQATAILDMQWRRGPRSEREKVRTEHEALVQQLGVLRASLADRR